MTYFFRSVKYFCALCVLCAVVMALNQLAGFARLSMGETLSVMFHTTRGLLLPVAVVVLSALYPLFGFIVREVEGDLTRHREQVINALRTSGFVLVSERDGVLHFRAESLMQKLLLLGEDDIEVSQVGDRIRIDGIRRAVARIAYRLDSYIEMVGKNE